MPLQFSAWRWEVTLLHRALKEKVPCEEILDKMKTRLGAGLLAAVMLCVCVMQQANAEESVTTLFGADLRNAAKELHYGGLLSDESVYAYTVTGASWENAWGKNQLFWMGWLPRWKFSLRGKKQLQARADVKNYLVQHDYSQAFQLLSGFTQQQIAADPVLKEAAARQLLQQGEASRALSVLASAYHTMHKPDEARDYRLRRLAFRAARLSGDEKQAIAFGLSLVLQPDPATHVPYSNALAYLVNRGVNLRRVALGILEAPNGLRNMSAYTYAAADVLVYRLTPSLLPLLFEMLKSGDTYLRSRALLYLGAMDYRPGSQNRSWTKNILPVSLRDYGLSADQHALIMQTARRLLHDSNFRLRAAACLTLSFMGGEENHRLLETMANDPAYVLQKVKGHNESTVVFPVRDAADAALTRWGENLQSGDGTYTRSQLSQLLRRGRNVTNDRSGIRGDLASVLAISPTDVALPVTDQLQ